MITLRSSSEEELKVFVGMELQTHAINFVNSMDLDTHIKKIKKPNVIYLSIENSNSEVSGYFILVIEPDTESVEFQRIVIDENCRGVGQIAITQMENYCRNKLHSKRIWLDVYEDNLVGKHIYEKLGYKKFKESTVDERALLFYQKML